MPVSKKRKQLSSLSGLELRAAYNSLLQLKSTIVVEETEEDSEGDPNESAPEGFVQQVDTMLALLGSKLEGPQFLSFSSVAMDDLAKLNIVFAGILSLKPIANERIASTTSLGQDKLWSSKNLYRQLHLLETAVPRTNEATARAWIDAFLFRTSAMLSPDKRMILNMEHAVPATNISSSSLSTLSGYVDYTAFVATERVASDFLSFPHLKTFMKNDMPSGFFIVEAKFLINIVDHVSPQAVSEIYACGKFLQTQALRGALTNGRDWIFLLMKFNNNFDGAIYKQSKVVGFSPIQNLINCQLEIPEPMPDVIAAILSHWIENSFADLGSDDWFEP